mmetsp:Transcript_100609/g.285043  ORF Transcript_100609/g.285043 Transcript_100609/m.285043 type:complete len:225 (+) Transcript_100609:1880-2554(+)
MGRTAAKARWFASPAANFSASAACRSRIRCAERGPVFLRCSRSRTCASVHSSTATTPCGRTGQGSSSMSKERSAWMPSRSSLTFRASPASQNSQASASAALLGIGFGGPRQRPPSVHTCGRRNGMKSGCGFTACPDDARHGSTRRPRGNSTRGKGTLFPSTLASTVARRCPPLAASPRPAAAAATRHSCQRASSPGSGQASGSTGGALALGHATSAPIGVRAAS